MEHDPPFEIPMLMAYLAGDAEPDQAVAIERWAASDSSRQAWLASLQVAWDPGAAKALAGPSFDEEALLGSIASGIQSKESSRKALPTERKKTVGIVASLCAAAAVAIAVLGTGMMRNPEPVKDVRYATEAGQIARIALDGGTIMTLGPAAEAVIRESGVTVSGEAYFDVVPDPGQPFLVHTANATVQVLGTRFAVRQYPNDVGSTVVVEDGKVSLRHKGPQMDASPAVLTANMRGEITDSTVVVTSGIAVNDYTGWIQGRLRFERARVGDVLAALARAYGVTITIPDSTISAQRVTMAASVSSDPVIAVLEKIGRMTNAHVVRQDESLTLAPGRPAASQGKVNPLRSEETRYGK